MPKYRSLPYYGGKRGYGKAERIAGLLPWRLVELTPRSRAEFRWACDAIDAPAVPPLRRALAFHITISHGINRGTAAVPSNWRREVNPAVGTLGHFSADEISSLAQRLRDVQLESIDACDPLERTADCEYAVIYADPLYPTANRSPYRYGAMDYPQLAELLAAQTGAVAISG